MYFKYLKMQLKSASQYKTNLFLLATSSVIISLGELISVLILFKTFKTVGNWGFYESLLMFGVITMCYALVECFARGFDTFSELIQNGSLCQILIRPVNVLTQIFGSKIELSKVGRIFIGLGCCIFALIKMNISWNILKVLVIIGMVVCSCLVVFGLICICAGISVFTIENLEVLNIISNGSKELSYYPINIYSKWLRRFFTFIIPLACFNYLPLSFLTGTGNIPMWLCAISPFIGSLFVIPCILFFLWAVKKFEGTGT